MPISFAYRAWKADSIWRLPYEQSSSITALFQTAQQLAKAIGFDLHGGRGRGRGGSDANLVAAHAPVLDGLGPVGGGAHTLGERIDLTSLQPRTRLLRELMLTLA